LKMDSQVSLLTFLLCPNYPSSYASQTFIASQSVCSERVQFC
jgi:hypothetical protein